MAAGKVHGLSAWGATSGKGVAGAIDGAEVRLGFDDSENEAPGSVAGARGESADEVASEEVGSKLIGRAAKEVDRQRAEGVRWGTG